MVDEIERAFSEHTGIPYCVALASGTAAMHLALKHVLQRGPRSKVQGSTNPPLVIASTLTFIGSVSPATYEGCDITFIDCDRESWNMDLVLLEEELNACASNNRLPVAVIPTDLYGQCCDLARIVEICDKYQVPVICDSAEAMGGRYQESGVRCQVSGNTGSATGGSPLCSDRGGDANSSWRHAGYSAWASVFSFNGNKIITTSGGGMLASHDKDLIGHARKLATQSRDDAPHYEHSEIGYNYRMSNIVAAIGVGQLKVLDERVAQKRNVFARYRELLDDLPGITFMPEPSYSRSNRWLTVILIDSDTFGATPERIRQALEAENIEARPLWQPMHVQRCFMDSAVRHGRICASLRQGGSTLRFYGCRGGAVAEDLFARGLCLPSGSAMTDSDIERVCNVVRAL